MTLTVLPAGVKKKAKGAARVIKKSLRVRKSASAKLTRNSAASNRRTWTWSGWVKRGELGGHHQMFGGSDSGGTGTVLLFLPTNQLQLILNSATITYWNLTTTAVFRDISAWYHIVCSLDTTQAVDANRLKIYVNGAQTTSFATATYPPLNDTGFVNHTLPHYIGMDNTNYADLYLAEVNFIDGQALDPTSFGEIDASTGVWTAKKYAGTYGTNGFHLNFEDNTNLTALGHDSSGNNNHWTPSNISLSGVTYDSMNDVPAPIDAAVGNYCTWNPLNNTTALSNANLNALGTASAIKYSAGTFAVSSGKYYFEYIASAIFTGAGVSMSFGLAKSKTNVSNVTRDDVYFYNNNGSKYGGGSAEVPYGASYAVNDVIGVALDMDAGTVSFYKSNVSQGVAFSNLKGQSIMTFISTYDVASCSINCGQRPFTNAPPAGFLPLQTFNLPDPAVPMGSAEMDALIDTGANIKTKAEALYSGSQFLEWIKDRANVNNHQLIDSVRGLSKVLQSNTNAIETTYTAPSGNSVAWVWKAGGAPIANNDGSIASMVSANKTAGFSVVTYTGTNANGATIGHGLGVAPRLIIIKNRSSSEVWPVYHSSVGATKYLVLNTGAAEATAATPWNNTAPTSTVFSLGIWNALNENGSNHVAYCWAPIAGYSAFGSYTGNGNADGTFVHTGFSPKFVMVKRTDSGNNWFIVDAKRNAHNLTNNQLQPNASSAESSNFDFNVDIVANGFKLRTAYDASNASGGKFIYAAFAEHPFKHSLAR